VSNEFSEILDHIPPSGIRRFFDLVIGRDDIISLGVGEPDFDTPWNIREQAILAIEKGYTSYTSNRGLTPLLEGISQYVSERFSVSYDPMSEVLITVGASEAIDITLRALLNPGDEVILPEPCFVCYSPLVQLAHGKPITIDTSKTEFIPDPAEIKKRITPKTKAIMLCSPNNPTGRIIPKSVMREIASLAEKHNFWIISDEIYAELTYDQDYTSFAALPDMKNRTVLLNGFSKAFAMTGWRLGFMCAPAELLARTLKIHQYSMMCAPILSQYAGIEALKHSMDDVKKMKTSYLQRRNLFVSGLKETGLDVVPAEGTFYCFMNIKNTGLSSEAFAIQLLEKESVAVVPGTAFGTGGEGYLRCCYATSTENLQEALVRIKRFVQSL